MKRFLLLTAAFKSIACMVFAGQVMVYVVLGSFFGLTNIAFSFIWQFFFISVASALLQIFAFSELVIVNMKYTGRLFIFMVPLYLILSALAVVFNWFPISAASWLLFTGLFFIITGIITAAFEIYFKVTGKKYNQLLEVYKSSNL